MAIIWNTFVD